MNSKKRCFKCGQVQPLSAFYTHKRMADGHLNKCKACTCKDVDTRRRRLEATDPDWVLRERRIKREKSARYREAGRARRLSAEEKNASIVKYRQKFPEKARAHRLTRHAIKMGKLLPARCPVCGFPITDAHHEDYSKPLDVMWLCRPHHMQRHVEKNEVELIQSYASVS